MVSEIILNNGQITVRKRRNYCCRQSCGKDDRKNWEMVKEALAMGASGIVAAAGMEPMTPAVAWEMMQIYES